MQVATASQVNAWCEMNFSIVLWTYNPCLFRKLSQNDKERTSLELEPEHSTDAPHCVNRIPDGLKFDMARVKTVSFRFRDIIFI